jgi:hypothetical protein
MNSLSFVGLDWYPVQRSSEAAFFLVGHVFRSPSMLELHPVSRFSTHRKRHPSESVGINSLYEHVVSISLGK